MQSIVTLRALFGTLLPLALAPVGCGGSMPMLAQTLCTGISYEPLADLSLPPGPSVPYLELRVSYGGTGQGSAVATSGTACTNATDVDACRSALETADVTTGFESLPGAVSRSGDMGPSRTYLVVERDGIVTTVSTDAELRALLGPIDSLKEAALLASVRGYRVVCGADDDNSTGEASGADWRVSVQSGFACGEGTKLEAHVLRVGSSGDVSIESTTVLEHGSSNCAIGRRPHGLVAIGTPLPRTVGELFAEQAHLEAASVDAFAQLESELIRHGAPEALVRRTRRARADEIRHAITTTALAERFGASVAPHHVIDTAPRSLFELALDNAVEGCVRETYGALVAEVQARRAGDPQIARAMQVIAREETTHAALSWDLATWFESQLTAHEIESLRDAQHAAFTALRASLVMPYSREIQEHAGMPAPAVAVALLDGLAASLVPVAHAA